MNQRLTESLLLQGVRELTESDRDLETIVTKYGPPPLWERSPGFPTLIQTILEQQVSLASGKAAYDRLEKALGTVTPEHLLTLSDDALKQIGFSRQKTRYGRELAQTIIKGQLKLQELDDLPDAAVRMQLMQVTGIGRWTANIYLLMALGRPDVWPSGDIALHAAIQQVKGLDKRPSSEEANAISQQWQPWRAIAARLLWHWYLSEKAAKAG